MNDSSEYFLVESREEPAMKTLGGDCTGDKPRLRLNRSLSGAGPSVSARFGIRHP